MQNTTATKKHRVILLLSLKGKWCRTWGFWFYRWKEKWGGLWEEACGPWSPGPVLAATAKARAEPPGWEKWKRWWRNELGMACGGGCHLVVNLTDEAGETWWETNIGRAAFYQVRQALSWETHFFLEVLFSVFFKKQQQQHRTYT